MFAVHRYHTIFTDSGWSLPYNGRPPHRALQLLTPRPDHPARTSTTGRSGADQSSAD
jgi:hypothetical protein